jgi:hypothetical protein
MSAYRHDHYNRDHFPIFVINHGNWDIMADERGYCAAIPTESAAGIGCKATHFGDMAYVRQTILNKRERA